MPDFLDLIETIRVEEASTERLFADAGRGLRGRRSDPRYGQMLAEAAELVADVFDGRRPTHRLAEALTTSDFPSLFGDVIDRQMLARYNEYPSGWRNYIQTRTVRDFRTVKSFALDGAEGILSEVAEKTEYPMAALAETYDSWSVKKFGRRLHFSWETFVNDDLDAFRDLPDRLARGARRSEAKFATTLYVDVSGPHASLYTSAHKNIVTGNPALSISALQTAMAVLAAQVDDDGGPIYIEDVVLVVPPALEVVARNIVNAEQLWLTAAGGVSGQQMIVANWMRNRTSIEVDPYIPLVATSANGSASWFLFARVGADRPAIQVGFLRGHETPELFQKDADASRVGGQASPTDGDFDTDSLQWKVRHVFGGGQMNTTKGYKTTVASNGSGS